MSMADLPSALIYLLTYEWRLQILIHSAQSCVLAYRSDFCSRTSLGLAISPASNVDSRF
jgi:hypothetical protein